MDGTRRKLMLGTGAAGAMALATAAGLATPGSARAVELKPRELGVSDFDTVMNEIGGLQAQTSGGIQIALPDVAEQGSMVPIEVNSQIPGSESIAILVENNAIPVVARFEFKNGALARVATRIKMAESSPVHVVVRAAGRNYRATKSVKAVIGGCGDEGFASGMKSRNDK